MAELHGSGKAAALSYHDDPEDVVLCTLARVARLDGPIDVRSVATSFTNRVYNQVHQVQPHASLPSPTARTRSPAPSCPR